MTVVEHTCDWLEQAFWRSALQEVTGGATGRGFEELIAVLVGRKANDRESAGQPPQLMRKIMVDFLRGIGIDQRQIRQASREVAESVARVGVRRRASETRLAVDAPDQGATDAGLGFQDRHPDVSSG